MSRRTAFALLLPAALAWGQGLEFGVSYALQRPALPSGHEPSGVGFHGAWDLSDPGRFRTQLRASYARPAADRATHDMLAFGLQQAWWSEGQEGHALLALEARAERLGEAGASVTYLRAWARGGLGFRGILVPLLPWNTGFVARGSERFVPFTRVELAVPLWKRSAPGFVPPNWELSLHLGLRMNLD